MLSASVPNLHMLASRMLGGVLLLPMDHPIALCLLLAGLAGVSAVVMHDAITGRP